MYRKNVEIGAELQVVMDEHDALLVAISLQRDSSSPNVNKLGAMQRRVIQLETR
jgi:hypothetical protein